MTPDEYFTEEKTSWLRSICANILNTSLYSEEVDDVYYAVFTGALKNWDKCHKKTLDGYDAWIYGLIRHKRIDYIRAKRAHIRYRGVEIHFEEHTAELINQEALLPQHRISGDFRFDLEKQEIMNNFLKKLNPKERKVVILRLEGLYFSEIETMTGIPASTARDWFQKALIEELKNNEH